MMLSNVSIRAKIILTQILLTGLVSVFIYTYYPNRQEKVMLASIESEINNLNNLFSIGVGIGMGEIDLVAVSEVLNWASSDSSAYYIQVENTIGQEVISYNPKEVNVPGKVVIAKGKGQFFDLGEMLFYKNDINYQNTSFGTLTIGYSLNQLHKEISALKTTTLYFCLILFLMNSGLSVIITNMITSNIKKLDFGVKSISEGNENIRVNISGNDEMAKLGRAFNQMLDRLDRSHEELKSYSERLRKQNEELNQFSYVVSHDLKAPLRAIFRLSEWIEEDLNGTMSKESKENIQTLRGRVFRLETLINGLLEYSKIGRTNISTQSTDVGVLIENIIDLLSPPSHFKINIQQDMPVLETKKVLLQQVFINLIANAIKFNNNREPVISISAEDTGEFYQFTVVDNGIGIDPAYHDKIFVIFQTLEARDKVEGAGVGLSIVEKSVTDAGGTIRVESEIGKGAKFIFTWPKQWNEKHWSKEMMN